MNSKFIRPSAEIKWLSSKTSDAWIDLALSNPNDILVDHAHCERKAAGMAIELMFRYFSHKGLSEVLSPVAREELEHYERVLNLIVAKGDYLRYLPAPPYGAKLSKNIRKKEPYRMLDSFLIASLIEARSHERMYLISLNTLDNQLQELYSDLLLSESKHFGIYWKLSIKNFSKELVEDRMIQLSNIESDILSELYPKPRIHS